ncbi:DUF4221 family protein [Algoriphagus sp.]|uniref:DUF4221 family protein n=1 Tax=Algoriphagus sp. TaxID=1872435 RepID=UPI003295C0D4
MKKTLLFFCLPLFFSCGENSNSEKAESENILDNLTFTVDTLILDVGEEIFNPGAYYGRDLNEDGEIAYWFYEPEKQIHEYDLANLKLKAIHSFETDGPNAIPSYLNNFQALPNQEFFMADYAKTGVYSLDGAQVLNLRIQLENIAGFDPEATFSLTNNVHLSPDKKKILSLPNNFAGPVEGFAVIDREKMTGNLRQLPALEITDKYNVSFEQGNGISRSGDFQSLQYLNELFFIYSGATSDIYTYDWKTDSLTLHSFPHRLVAKSKTGDFATQVDSNERRWEVGKEMRKQITFGKFYWDESRSMYFRFGSMTNENDKTTVYLFAYDGKLNLQGETAMEGLENMFYQAFFRKGKLYNYSIVGEDPALIEYSFDF